LAAANVAWSAISTPKTGGESDEANGNWIRVFEKQTDGTVAYMTIIYTNTRAAADRSENGPSENPQDIPEQGLLIHEAIA